MARTAQPITLTDDECRSIRTLIRRGSTAARTKTRARVLALLYRQHPAAIADTLGVSVATIFNIKRHYLTDGRDRALRDTPCSGKPATIDGTARLHHCPGVLVDPRQPCPLVLARACRHSGSEIIFSNPLILDERFRVF